MYCIRNSIFQTSSCMVAPPFCLLFHSQFWKTTIIQSEHLKLETFKNFKALPGVSSEVLFSKRKLEQFRFFFSTIVEPILVQARDPSRLTLNIASAIEEERFEDALKEYEKHVHMDGFPRRSIINKLITSLAESCDGCWLEKAYEIVDLLFHEKKHDLLDKTSLLYLSFVLARCQNPILASNALRKLVQMEEFPPVAAWSGVIGHLCQTENGAFLAAELIMEIAYLFKDNRVDPRKKSNRPLLSMKPNSFVFNLVLTGCILHEITRKGDQLLELMPRVGVKPDTDLLIIMAQIYEKNGWRDEIDKLKRHVDEACGLNDFQIQIFYNCLLSCHLKFGDVDFVAGAILDLLRKSNEAKSSLAAARSVLEAVDGGGKVVSSPHTFEVKKCNFTEKMLLKSHAPTYSEFTKDERFSRIEAEARESLVLLSEKLTARVELVRSKNGILHPTDTIYAKLARGFLEMNRIRDLAVFIIKASKEESPVCVENSVAVQVIDACISLGLLGQAHDLLDEMRFSGVRIGPSVYSSLLKAYCKDNRHAEINALLKDACKAGIQLDSSCYECLIQSRVNLNDSSGALLLFKEMKASNISISAKNEFEKLVEGYSTSGEAGLMSKLLEEIKYNQKVDYGVHDWNSVIHFFCKKKMMHDAQKALNKMRALGHTPNAHTFHSLVTGYAAIGGKYVEVTDLWGDMKVIASSSSMKFDQELLDSFLYCFVRGGFFLRAMEVIEMMEAEKMFMDKFKYRSLWLKYHRTLYKGKAPKIQTESQYKRREACLCFKKWIGLT
ncbi:Pentatricopeptide repeat-containing protein [Platanthera guangdongensis]|uniref:Pentatricopeptide repeat-containing protein n=1 Tax=Platanthera guangdongensis TaxID=2320717 RepID=A0ABR2LY31_9ASPA